MYCEINEIEKKVAPLKNLFFQVVLKLDMKDTFRYKKETERMGKTFLTI